LSFYKFPKTPHLFVLPGLEIRNDKVMSVSEQKNFLSSRITVEEKVDGANIGISLDHRNMGTMVFQNRGNILKRGEFVQFEALWEWSFSRLNLFQSIVKDEYIVFGEWCYAEHSIHYSKLPDWFLGFDVFDKANGLFFTVEQRNLFFDKLHICKVPFIASSRFTKDELETIANKSESAIGGNAFEGIYLRQESGQKLLNRAKVVKADFVQNINEHWSRKKLLKNQIL
jgi:ATP-dependent RNA circularization protein (DNA/RNA ligase family)